MIMIDFDKVELDEEERGLEDSFERGEWRSVENLESEIRRYQDYARSFSKRAAADVDKGRSPTPAADPVTHHG